MGDKGAKYWSVKAVTVVAALLLAGCSVGGGRSTLLSLDTEKPSAQALAAKIGSSPLELKQAFDSSPLLESRQVAKLSTRIKARVGTSADNAMQHHLQQMLLNLTRSINTRGFNYQVVLLESDQINAFTPGAGKIFINEGMLVYCETEGQIAAVMAHEIAHVAMRHPQDLRQIEIVAKAGDSIMQSFRSAGLDRGIEKFMRLGGKAGLNSMIRQKEMLADTIGMNIMVKAGYDPREMLALLRQLGAMTPEMARFNNIVYGDHPLSKDREAAVARKIKLYFPKQRGTVTSAKFDRLIAPYRKQRLNRMASQY